MMIAVGHMRAEYNSRTTAGMVKSLAERVASSRAARPIAQRRWLAPTIGIARPFDSAGGPSKVDGTNAARADQSAARLIIGPVADSAPADVAVRLAARSDGAPDDFRAPTPA